MRATDQLLIAIVSGEGAVIIGLVGWTWRTLASQVKQTAKDLRELTELVGKHLAVHEALEKEMRWHEGLDDRNAWRSRG